MMLQHCDEIHCYNYASCVSHYALHIIPHRMCGYTVYLSRNVAVFVNTFKGAVSLCCAKMQHYNLLVTLTTSRSIL